MSKKLLISGGANSAHVLSVLAGVKGYNVTVLTRRPKEWGSSVSLMLQNDKDILKHSPQITSDPEAAKTHSNIMICGPVSATLSQLKSLKGSIQRDQEVYLGTIFGQGGFDYMTRHVFPEEEYPNLKTFSLQKIPWLCKATEYGKSARILGSKKYLNISTDSKETFNYSSKLLNDILEVPVHKISPLENILIPANNVIHPGRYYGLFENWNFKDAMYVNQTMPKLYEDIDEKSAHYIQMLDNELIEVVDALREKFPNESHQLKSIKP